MDIDRKIMKETLRCRRGRATNSLGLEKQKNLILLLFDKTARCGSREQFGLSVLGMTSTFDPLMGVVPIGFVALRRAMKGTLRLAESKNMSPLWRWMQTT